MAERVTRSFDASNVEAKVTTDMADSDRPVSVSLRRHGEDDEIALWLTHAQVIEFMQDLAEALATAPAPEDGEG